MSDEAPSTKKKKQGNTVEQEIDHDHLQNLVNQMVKLPAQPDPVDEEGEDIQVPRMSGEEIKSIKAIKGIEPTDHMSLKEAYATSFIRLFEDVLGMLSPKAKRTRCQLDGHFCKHCGEHIVLPAPKAEDPEGPRRRS